MKIALFVETHVTEVIPAKVIEELRSHSIEQISPDCTCSLEITIRGEISIWIYPPPFFTIASIVPSTNTAHDIQEQIHAP